MSFSLPRLTCLALVIAAFASLFAVATADARRTITPEIDSSAGLRVGGRDVSVSGPLSCQAGHDWRVSLVVTQGGAREDAVSAGKCTGTVQEWRTRVSGNAPGHFDPGTARACAQLTATAAGGDVSRERRWCQNVRLVSEAGVAGGDDEEDDDDALSLAALIVGGLALVLGAAAFLLSRRRPGPGTPQAS